MQKSAAKVIEGEDLDVTLGSMPLKGEEKNAVKANVLRILKEKYDFILICPEVFGGLPTPRVPSEIIGDKVMNSIGEDVTLAFHKGADMALELAKKHNCKIAVLKAFEEFLSFLPSLFYDLSYKYLYTIILFS